MIVHPRFRAAWAAIQKVPDNYLHEGTEYIVNKRNPGIHSGSSFGSLVPWFISILLYLVFHLLIFDIRSIACISASSPQKLLCITLAVLRGWGNLGKSNPPKD
jgi:hypothetical protein